MLFHPVFHGLRAVPGLAQVAVDSPHQRIAPVAEFLAHRVRAHRGPAVQRLLPRGAVAVAEAVQVHRPRREADARRHRIQQTRMW